MLGCGQDRVVQMFSEIQDQQGASGQSGDIMVVGWTLFGEVLLCHLQSKNETINQELLSMPSKP